MGKQMDMVASFAISFMLMFGMLLFTGKDVRVISVLAAICALCFSVIVKSIQKKAKVFSFRRRRNSASRRVKALIYKENKEVKRKKALISGENHVEVTIYYKDGTIETRKGMYNHNV